MSDRSIRALPPIVHDPAALWAARYEVRRAYTAIQRLRQADPTIRDLLNRLDEIAVELTTELESIEPQMQLRSVRIIPIALEAGR